MYVCVWRVHPAYFHFVNVMWHCAFQQSYLFIWTSPCSWGEWYSSVVLGPFQGFHAKFQACASFFHPYAFLWNLIVCGLQQVFEPYYLEMCERLWGESLRIFVWPEQSHPCNPSLQSGVHQAVNAHVLPATVGKFSWSTVPINNIVLWRELSGWFSYIYLSIDLSILKWVYIIPCISRITQAWGTCLNAETSP